VDDHLLNSGTYLAKGRSGSGEGHKPLEGSINNAEGLIDGMNWSVVQTSCMQVCTLMGLDNIEVRACGHVAVIGYVKALGALGSDALRVRDSNRGFWGSSGFGLWLQLMCCAYLLSLSEYFE